MAAANKSMEMCCRARSSGQDAGELLHKIVDTDRQAHTLLLSWAYESCP